MLIEIPEGIVNTDYVVCVRASGGSLSEPGGTITLADGTTQTTQDLRLFEQACGVVVPAGPGFDVVTAILPDESGNSVAYFVETVIAFRIGAGWGDVEPVPITLRGRPDTLSNSLWTVRQPNGTCSGPDGPHTDLAAFKADCERAATSKSETYMRPRARQEAP